MDQTLGKPEDFLRLRNSGAVPGVGFIVGSLVGRLRDVTASTLAPSRVSPNALTWAGFAVALGAGACFTFGAADAAPWAGEGAAGSWWPVAAGFLLLGSGAFDLLDGALARAGRRQSPYGAILDSTLDRCSDAAILLGCAIHFAHAGNPTYVALSALAAASWFLVSYVKARAENFVERCDTGYWQRGERLVLFAAAALLGHVPAGLWLLGLGPWATVVRRVRRAAGLLGPPRKRVETPAPSRITFWRHPRGSLGYDLWTLLLLLFLFAAPLAVDLFGAGSDPLGALLRRWNGS